MTRYVREVRVERVASDPEEFPFTIPALAGLERLALSTPVTFLVGENGSGKSTLLEGIAMAIGLNAEGGSRHMNFAHRPSESGLWRYLKLIRGALRERDSYFLRAESYFNVGTELEDRRIDLTAYGGVSVHEQSHGESFLRLIQQRFLGRGLYLLDEPEAALSPSRQIAVLGLIHDLVGRGASQFIIATHSPIILSYPGAEIYVLDDDGVRLTAYKETEAYRVTREFLAAPERYLRLLFDDED